jgi:phospholipase C
MTRMGLRRAVAGCVVGVGCAIGVPVLAHAQDAKGLVGRVKPDFATPGGSQNDGYTTTPIKHVIYIIGENRTFDHGFGTFVAKPGQSVWNLLSEGIVYADGSPGPNWTKAQQWMATDSGGPFSIHPTKTKPFSTLPPINTDGAPTNAPFSTVAAVKAVEPALLASADTELTTGGTGQGNYVVDTRFPAGLADGPFDISKYVSYDSYTSSPVHRFYQMWQQIDCDITKATKKNPSGCQSDLFPWVEVTIGAGSNGKPLPAGFNDEETGEGATSMGYFNVQNGDAPYFTELATKYALNDNYHQAIQGGTGANHIAVGFGTLIYYADASGGTATPPSNQIENPTPLAGTNNWYTQDGYSGGSYVGCWNTSLPGISAVRTYLNSLPYNTLAGDCAPNAYYLVNNYNPGYLGNGTPAPLGPTQYTIPPSSQNNIGLLLSDYHVSWKYYGEGWAGGAETGENSTYCNICNPFLYSKQIMTNASLRANLQDIQNLYNDLESGKLPAVSIVKPDGYLDGHPASSKWDLYEGFVKKIITKLQANSALWDETAVFITEDEGGGYYDSGYIQPIDFFGDGTRIPLIIVSPYSEGVGMVHSYGDHVSFAKFVEANWGLEHISGSSRDNLPNPISTEANPYVPVNPPAITDMMSAFNFHKHHHAD